jgi:hypothetical protein
MAILETLVIGSGHPTGEEEKDQTSECDNELAAQAVDTQAAVIQ